MPLLSPLKDVDSLKNQSILTTIHSATDPSSSIQISTSNLNTRFNQPISSNLLQNVLEDALQQYISILRQDIQNIHLDVIKQFQLQQNEFKEMIRGIDYKHEEQKREIENLKVEIRRLKLKYGE